MVGVTKIQRGNAGYWLAAVAEGGEDYYTKPGEAPGEWVGELADELELSGQVDAESYSAILEGRDPTSGKQLLRRPEIKYRTRPDGTQKRVEPVLGYDVRFSAPKSVSILYALGDEATRERVVGVVNEGVRQGLAHLEHEACFVQRGRNGHRIERGEGFVGMAFRHRMSRAGDPALHVHVVVSNLTRAASDGKWLSLASPQGRSPLFPHGKSAGVVFQAALRAEFLREFGLDFADVKNGYADLHGFDRAVIDALSTRSKEIATWLEKHGVNSVEAAQTAAYRTRDKKDYGVSEDERREEWIATAEPHGVTPESVGAMVAEARPREPRRVTAEDVTAALSKLEQTSSHFDRRALLWALCDQLPEGADRTTLTAAVDQVLASEKIVCVYESSGPLDFDQYTTPRLAEMEQRFIAAALDGADAGVAQVSNATLSAVLDRHDYLGADQREMVIRLTTGGERIIPVAALPGTGKTTALKAAREAWQAEGITVIGCATARTASAELSYAGVPSTSIRRLLNVTDRRRVEGKEPLPRGTVILADESSMTSTPDLDALRFLAAECDGKLVPIGDPRQIGAIGPGGAYGHLTRATEPITLDTIRRQSRPEDRELVKLVHERRGSEALDLLQTQGRVIVGDDLDATLKGQLLDWHNDFATGADVVMIARRNRDVDYLNETARELRREEGALGSAEVIVGERPFAAGDHVLTRINAEHVANRERWEVLGVDAAARTVELRNLGGDERVVTLNAHYLDRRTDDGAPALDYGYALTNFGAQGKTFDRAYPFLDAGGDQEQQLVAVSRGREIANVYVVASTELVDPDLGPGLREISDALHDVRIAIEREGNDYTAAEVSLRKQIEQLAPSELAARRVELVEAGRAADPVLHRRDQLDREIKDAGGRVEWLRREREAIEAMREPPAHELARVATGEANQFERLQRCIAEREALPESTATAEPRPPDPSRRLEAVLVDQRIDNLARRDVQEARLEPNHAIYNALGPHPGNADPDKALAWSKGAHEITTYRRRHGITDKSDALGRQPKGAAARAERARAQRRLAEAQRRLGRTTDRSAQRSASRAISIGR
jgi:conjugative relaxase-like TrwC/TraI family protein